MKSAIAVLVGMCLLLAQTTSLAQSREEFWAKYEGGYPGVAKKHKGRVYFDNERRALVFLKGGKRELFAIPYDTITVVSADETARRRVKETVLVGILTIGLFALPILFSKKKLRYVLVEYEDPSRDTAGGAVFQVKGKDKVGVLVLIGRKAKLERRGELYARPGIELEAPTQTDKQTPDEQKAASDQAATSPVASTDLCVVEVKSVPEAADVEIDGRFVGNTPTTLKLPPGDYEVVVKKAGYGEWKRVVRAIAGSELNLVAELEKKE